jgi:hypothetical protein
MNLNRPTCVALVREDETWVYRVYIPISGDEGTPCGKPAVDFQEADGEKYWLCAEHWDSMTTSTSYGEDWEDFKTRTGYKKKAEYGVLERTSEKI